MNLTWSWFVIFFMCMCCWIQFANILLWIFASIFMKDTAYETPFVVVLLSGVDFPEGSYDSRGLSALHRWRN